MAPRPPETLEDFVVRLGRAVESGQTQVRFGSYHHSHAVCLEDGAYRVRALEHTAEEAKAYLETHGMFMPEHAEQISTPRTLVFEAGSLEDLTRKLHDWWPWTRRAPAS